MDAGQVEEARTMLSSLENGFQGIEEMPPTQDLNPIRCENRFGREARSLLLLPFLGE
jgi:hypothetical protein